jgi:ribosome biogenesis GTPase
MRLAAQEKSGLPVVGDWVAIRPLKDRTLILGLLPRKSAISRNAAGGKTEEQVLASNIDTVFLVSALDGGRNFNLRRIERILTLAYESGAAPVVVLNKADLCDDPDAKTAQAESVAPGVPLYVVSAREDMGVKELSTHLGPGRTGAFLGPSGVGKSTLINAMMGTERQRTIEVREDDLRGRHATTARELILLPGGGILIDTPGMREIQLWSSGADGPEGFEDIEELTHACRFRDCRHLREPGCAVHQALEEGSLARERYESYLELRGELAYMETRKEYLAAKRERFRKISVWSKSMKKGKGKR